MEDQLRERMKSLRIERGLSQVKLSARADLDPSTISEIERGKRQAAALTMRKVALALGVSLSELLGEREKKRRKLI